MEPGKKTNIRCLYNGSQRKISGWCLFFQKNLTYKKIYSIMIKKIIFFLLVLSLGLTDAGAKDIKTFVVKTDNTTAKADSVIAAEAKSLRGVKSVRSDVKTHTLMLRYDADVTSPGAIIEAFRSKGHKAEAAGKADIDAMKKNMRESRRKSVDAYTSASALQ